MAIKLIKNNDEPNAVAINHNHCMTESDIALLPKFEVEGKFDDPHDSLANKPCSIGTTALVIETSEDYILAPNNEWTKVSKNSGSGSSGTNNYNDLTNTPLSLNENGEFVINSNYEDFFNSLGGGEGKGISDIIFVSSTMGDVPAISGAIDTYKIVYTDNTATYYQVSNGSDGFSPTINVETTDNSIIFNVTNRDKTERFEVTTTEFSSVKSGSSVSDFPEQGEENMIYLDNTDGKLYYYSNNEYVPVAANLDAATDEDINNIFN